MKKLKIPSNLTTLAYNSIKEYILEGRLDENSRLTEEFLSTQLGISKSPIREALNRLETEGLIGLLANTLVLRGGLTGDPTPRHLLRQVRETVLDLLPEPRFRGVAIPVRKIRIDRCQRLYV